MSVLKICQRGPRIEPRLEGGQPGWPRSFGSRFWTSALATCLLSACAARVPEAARFSGSERAPLLGGAEIQNVHSLPAGFEVLGRVEARCRAWSPSSPLERLPLSNVDCTPQRLQSVLRDKARAVGGQLVVRERCGTGSRRWGERAGEQGWLACRAEVARPDAETLERSALSVGEARARQTKLAATALEAARLDDPTAAEAWRILVTYHVDEAGSAVPASLPPYGPSRPAAAVNELTDLPPSHFARGTLLAACDASCSLDAVRASVRVAAGRLGASDVVGVHCVPDRSGWQCSGRVATAEVAP